VQKHGAGAPRAEAAGYPVGHVEARRSEAVWRHSRGKAMRTRIAPRTVGWINPSSYLYETLPRGGPPGHWAQTVWQRADSPSALLTLPRLKPEQKSMRQSSCSPELIHHDAVYGRPDRTLAHRLGQVTAPVVRLALLNTPFTDIDVGPRVS